jgi:hypothetical protein
VSPTFLTKSADFRIEKKTKKRFYRDQAAVADILRSVKAFTHRIGVPVPIVKLRHRIAADVLMATVFGDESGEFDRQQKKYLKR